MKARLLWLLGCATVLVACLLFINGCVTPLKGSYLGTIDGTLDVYEDEERGVYCWVIRGTNAIALDCKAKNELPPVKKPAP